MEKTAENKPGHLILILALMQQKNTAPPALNTAFIRGGHCLLTHTHNPMVYSMG